MHGASVGRSGWLESSISRYRRHEQVDAVVGSPEIFLLVLRKEISERGGSVEGNFLLEYIDRVYGVYRLCYPLVSDGGGNTQTHCLSLLDGRGARREREIH